MSWRTTLRRNLRGLGVPSIAAAVALTLAIWLFISYRDHGRATWLPGLAINLLTLGLGIVVVNVWYARKQRRDHYHRLAVRAARRRLREYRRRKAISSFISHDTSIMMGVALIAVSELQEAAMTHEVSVVRSMHKEMAKDFDGYARAISYYALLYGLALKLREVGALNTIQEAMRELAQNHDLEHDRYKVMTALCIWRTARAYKRLTESFEVPEDIKMATALFDGAVALRKYWNVEALWVEINNRIVADVEASELKKPPAHP